MSLTLEEIKERLLDTYDVDDFLEALGLLQKNCWTGLKTS